MKSFVKSVSLGIAGILLVCIYLYPSFSHAQTASDLKAQIDELSRIISGLQAQLEAAKMSSVNISTTAGTSPTPMPTFLRNLKEGDDHPDIKALQKFLNENPATLVSTSGPGSQGNETTYFGAKTKVAVIKYQELYREEILTPNNLAKGTGFVGVSTRQKINTTFASRIYTPTSPPITNVTLTQPEPTIQPQPSSQPTPLPQVQPQPLPIVTQPTPTSPPATGGAIRINNVQSIANDTFQSGSDGSFISLNYTVPVNGLLVVSTGSTGDQLQPESVIFRKQNGQIETLHTPARTVASVTASRAPNQQYSIPIGNQVYYMPVVAGDSGTIEVRYTGGRWATSRRGIIASTLSGVSSLQSVKTFAVDNTSTINGSINVSSDAIVVSSLTSDGFTTLNVTGSSHVFDAQPMQDIQLFHSTRLASGHAVLASGSHSIGYMNSAGNFYNAVLILAAFR